MLKLPPTYPSVMPSTPPHCTRASRSNRTRCSRASPHDLVGLRIHIRCQGQRWQFHWNLTQTSTSISTPPQCHSLSDQPQCRSAYPANQCDFVVVLVAFASILLLLLWFCLWRASKCLRGRLRCAVRTAGKWRSRQQRRWRVCLNWKRAWWSNRWRWAECSRVEMGRRCCGVVWGA